MKILYFIVLLFSVLYASPTTSTQSSNQPSNDFGLTQEERNWLSQNPTIVIATTDAGNIAFHDNKGNIQGFDADLIAQINKNLNINLTIKLFSGWENAYDAAVKGQVDGILSLSNTKERQSIFYFSPSYHQAPTYIITRQNDYTIKSLSDLDKKIVATEKNNIINDIILKEAPQVTLVHAPTVKEILETVQKGKVHSAILEGVNNHDLEPMGLKISAPFYTASGEYTIGTHKSKPILAKIITKGINSISKNQMRLLKEKWFDQNIGKSIFTSEELNYIKNTPAIKIGIENWAPMISTHDGYVIEGITGELLTRVIQISGLKTQLVSGLWDALLHDFKEGKIDILPATYYTEERAKYGLFSDPYTQIYNTIYVNKDNQTIKSFADLEGKTLAIQKGFGTIEPIRKKFPKIKIIETPSLEDAIMKVSNNEVDAFFEAQIVAQNFLQKLLITNIKPIFQNSIEAKNLHILSTKDNIVLQSIINKSLNSIPPEEKNNIIDKWLHQAIKKNVNVAFIKDREPYTIDQSLVKGIEYDIIKRIMDQGDVILSSEKFLSREEMGKAMTEDIKLDIAVGVKQKEDAAFYYSDVLIDFENIVITREEDHFEINSIEDLKDKKIIAFEGAYKSLGKEYEKKFNPENRPLTYIETSKQDEQVLAFLRKKTDVLVIDKNVFLWYLKRLNSDASETYQFHALFPNKNSYTVAFREKNLRDFFNKKLQELKNSGQYADIFYHYLETNIEAKATISTLFSSLVAKPIFTEDVKAIQDITTAFSTLPYIQKIDVFNNENVLLVSHTKSESNTFSQYNSFYNLSLIPNKVGYVHIYFDDNELKQYAQNYAIIPNLKLFEHLSHYADIKETYKKLDFLEKIFFTQKEEAFIKNNPSIRFAGLLAKPLYFNNKEVINGTYIDFLKVIEQKSGLRFQLKSPVKTREELYEKFQNNEIDLIVAANNFDSQAFSSILSDEMMTLRLVIIANEKSAFTDGIKNIKGSVAVIKLSNAQTILKALYPYIPIIETETAEEALFLVAKGKATAFIANEALVPFLLEDFPSLKIVGIAKESTSHLFIAHSTQPELITIINKVLASMNYEQKQTIKDKWFKTKINTEVDYSIVYQIAGALVLVIILGFIYNQRLKYLVHQKTLELAKLLNSFDHNVIALKLDETGKIIYASEALCKISEYSQTELLGKSITLLSNKTNKRTLKSFKKAFLNQQPWHGKIINTSKSGKTYWTKTNLFQEYRENGNFLNHTIISQDITAQNKVELLYKEIEDTQKEIIFKMGAIGEARSEETGEHVKRVAEYSRLFALYCGLSDKEADIIKLASPMHDIGKVAIADAILNKPEQLTPEEIKIIQTHAELGYDMLKSSHRTILKAAAIIAHEHHEKYDGTGYPRGLKGEEIHIYGRITAIADVFDALGHDRVYKKAWKNETIFEFFKEERGKHFDPKLVDIFFQNIDKFLEIKNAFKGI
ncbi:transporter substrate-binding domain-containing protein [Sulfurospirillum oryzae]|uniref:transporter substrate-binding domain-containing protein n=1 Tax=Sulfurospirillum oryzae TaxID=2976535 RepID=UPI0021E71E05|nr:transporter substrate-binding domain-containing protein [Sulfurospirillum oryzae]